MKRKGERVKEKYKEEIQKKSGKGVEREGKREKMRES